MLQENSWHWAWGRSFLQVHQTRGQVFVVGPMIHGFLVDGEMKCRRAQNFEDYI